MCGVKWSSVQGSIRSKGQNTQNIDGWVAYLGGVIGLDILIDLEVHIVFICKISKPGGFPSDLSLCIFNKKIYSNPL